jgi:hypothetical protein
VRYIIAILLASLLCACSSSPCIFVFSDHHVPCDRARHTLDSLRAAGSINSFEYDWLKGTIENH